MSQRVKKEKSIDNRSKTGTTPGARAAHISLGAARPRQFLTDSLAAGPDNIGPARASTNYLRMFLYHGALRTEIQRSGSSCPEIERPRREPLLISVSKASSTRREIYNKMRLPSIEAHCVFFDYEKKRRSRSVSAEQWGGKHCPHKWFCPESRKKHGQFSAALDAGSTCRYYRS